MVSSAHCFRNVINTLLPLEMYISTKIKINFRVNPVNRMIAVLHSVLFKYVILCETKGKNSWAEVKWDTGEISCGFHPKCGFLIRTSHRP